MSECLPHPHAHRHSWLSNQMMQRRLLHCHATQVHHWTTLLPRTAFPSQLAQQKHGACIAMYHQRKGGCGVVTVLYWRGTDSMQWCEVIQSRHNHL